jgi:biopolymer transport protein ExbD
MQNGGNDQDVVTGINVTPMVDITLVLLIIFMVTASFVSDSALKVNLPKASTPEAAPTASLTIAQHRDGSLALMGDPVRAEALQGLLADEVRKNPGLRVTLASDEGLSYGQVVAVIDLIKRAGVTRVALATGR